MSSDYERYCSRHYQYYQTKKYAAAFLLVKDLPLGYDLRQEAIGWFVFGHGVAYQDDADPVVALLNFWDQWLGNYALDAYALVRKAIGIARAPVPPADSP